MEQHIQLIDPGTGLSTRGAFDHLFGFAFSLGDRGVPPTLVFLKPDGDDPPSADALNWLGQALRSVTRRTDIVARYESDEFVCLLVDCNRAGALVAADRLRTGLGETLSLSGMTLSFGIATYREEMKEPEELIDDAREALRVARQAGGDTTEVFSLT